MLLKWKMWMQVNSFYGLLSDEAGLLMICRGIVGGGVWGERDITSNNCSLLSVSWLHSVPGPHQQLSRIVLTDREHSCSAVTLYVSCVHQFVSSQRHTLEQKLWHKSRLTRALGRSSGARFATPELSLWIRLADFETRPTPPKTGPQTDSDRRSECCGRLRVHLRGAQRRFWTSRQRTTVPISLSPLSPNKLSRTRQNDSPLGCSLSFFLRYVLLTVSL